MEKISVSIRVRPLDKQEAAKGNSWKIDNNTIALCSSSGAALPNQVYIFDHVFATESTTLDIYRATTEDIVCSAVKGFNGTVFAYGQTSSGKTFTMRGTQDTPGIIPLAIHDVFKNLEQAVDREFLLRMSYMEIYNEDINDLLAPEQTKLQVHESLERGIFVAGLREEIVVNPEQVLQLMEFGEAHRHVGETNMNVHSSRSHTIFRMVIESRDKSQDDSLGFSCDAVRVSVLNLVDLAGSERVAKTGAEGARLKEGTHINKSLMVLGTVINKLSEGIQNQGGHVPYRDSKLTRILQPALGGNARTAVICNITPATVHVDESRGTLQFASRAIRVTNCAQVNEILTDAALLKRQKKEIEELRSKLKESHSEHFEEEILTLRNTLLKSECERERIALELQEEKRAHAERERKQAQKIENLSTLVLNSSVDERDFEKRWRRNARRETWCPRVTTGNILDEDARKPLKEDSWTAQSRDRLFPMPPPFESLLEEDESLNDKDAAEVHQASPHHQETNGADNDKDLDGSCCALPDLSARIHVADRKRKYCYEKSSVNEVMDGSQMLAIDSGVNEMDSVPCLKEGKRVCQNQETENFDSMHHKDEGDLQVLVDAGIQLNSSDPMVQQLLQELHKARDETLQYKHQLALALEELEQLKNQAQMSGKDTNHDFDSLVMSLRKEKEELAIQLTEAYLQFEEEKAAWAPADRPEEAAREVYATNAREDVERVKDLVEVEFPPDVLERNPKETSDIINGVYMKSQGVNEPGLTSSSVLETPPCGSHGDGDDRESMIQEIKHLGQKISELEGLIVDLKSEKAENVLQLNNFRNKMEELMNDAVAANTRADHERMEREKKVVEVTAMESKMNELKTKFLQERPLWDSESEEVRDLRLKLKSMEDLVCQKEVESSKDPVEVDFSPDVVERNSKETSEIIDGVYMKSQGKNEQGLMSGEAIKSPSVLETPLCGSHGDGDDREPMIQGIKHLEERISELESLIVDLKSEKAENVLRLNNFKNKMEELMNDAVAANTRADHERMEKEKKVLEVTAMQNKMNELETKFLQERALWDAESEEVRDLRIKLISMEDLLCQKEVESTKERWSLKTESLKLQVSLDATLARAEVFHGRLLEAQDDLKDAYEKLDNLKGLNKKETNEASVIAETSQIDMPNASVFDAAHDKSLKQIGAEVNAATAGPIAGQNGDTQLASCNVAQNSLIHVGKQRLQTFEKDLMSHSAVGPQVDSKMLEETKLPSSGNLAVSFPMRSTAIQRQEQNGAIGEGPGQSRPRLSILNGNVTASKRVASEAEPMPPLNKSSVSILSLKPPKALLVQKNASRSKAWPTNIQNKENR